MRVFYEFTVLIILSTIVFSCKVKDNKSLKIDDLLSQTKTLESSKLFLEDNPDNVDAVIWYGRRTAYTGDYGEAISIYRDGLEKFPDEPQLYRHRGHRYISMSNYDAAIKDFLKAEELIQNTEDVIEQDGIPNSQGIPISSLHGNIYYHLALAYYLKHDWENALATYDKRKRTHRNNDNIVSAAHWNYMALRRSGKHVEAEEILADITPDMVIIENMAYHRSCLFYKGLLSEEDLIADIEGESGKVNEVALYTLANWNIYNQKDSITARVYYERLNQEGNPYSFAYLAGKEDLKKLF